MFANRSLHRARMGLFVLALCAAVFVPAAVLAADCTRCKAALAPGAAFCTQCGQRVEAQAPKHVYCWQCGVEQPAGAKFCSRCGAQLDKTAAAPAGAAAAPDTAGAKSTSAPPKAQDGPWSSTAPAATASSKGSGIRLRPREIILPPQAFEAPTGDIVPSLAVHLGGGVAFGFSDKDQSKTAVLRFGLGDVAEALVSSSDIVHIVDVSSSALLGFRLRIPTQRHTPASKSRVRLALNLAASDENHVSDYVAFTSSDGVPVRSLYYTYRETTAGVAMTVVQKVARFHLAMHATDFRASNVTYATTGGMATGGDQRTVHASFAGAFDYRVNPRTWFLGEVTSSPEIGFLASTGELDLGSLWQCGFGVRFFPDPLLALDSSLHIDEEAVGLGDVQIGFGVHVMLQPHSVKEQNPAGAPPP